MVNLYEVETVLLHKNGDIETGLDCYTFEDLEEAKKVYEIELEHLEKHNGVILHHYKAMVDENEKIDDYTISRIGKYVFDSMFDDIIEQYFVN